jgi:hypothetical protein
MSNAKPIPLSRRHVFAAAGAAGALATAAAVLPRLAADKAAPVAKDAADKAGGYEATQHVLRYYQTARV